MQEITVEELAQWRESRRDFVLLDVREDDELETASLPDTVHVPMGQIPSRLGELDAQSDIAVICHYGGRSELVAQFLEQRGFSSVHNVVGGIDAYSERIDPEIPRY